MVTGWEEAVDVYNDAETFSSCISVTGPFPGFPVPLEGDDVTELIEQAPRRAAVQRPAADAGPADAHQPPRAADAADHPEAPQGERGRDVGSSPTQALDDFLAPGEGEFIKGFAGPFTLLVIADLLGVPEEDRDEFVKGIARALGWRLGGTGKETMAHSPAGIPLRPVRDVRRRTAAVSPATTC